MSKIRLQLKQGFFSKPYPVQWNGKTVGVLTPKNPEILAEVELGTHELAIRDQGEWVKQSIVIEKEFEVVHLHLYDMYIPLYRTLSNNPWMKHAMGVYVLICTVGYFWQGWSLHCLWPVLGFFIGSLGSSKEDSPTIKIKKFNPLLSKNKVLTC